MGIFFKSEYVIAMFHNKNSRLMSRILCIVDIFTQKYGPRGPDPNTFGWKGEENQSIGTKICQVSL